MMGMGGTDSTAVVSDDKVTGKVRSVDDDIRLLI
jgi:hypothetical protein